MHIWAMKLTRPVRKIRNIAAKTITANFTKSTGLSNGVSNSYAPLKRVLMHRPGDEIKLVTKQSAGYFSFVQRQRI